MSILRRQNRDLGDTSTQLVPQRTRGFGTVSISSDSALRSSAVWACLRLRADLISTMPLDVFRRVGPVQVSMTASPFLTDPDGSGRGLPDWLYASQVDLDRIGNAFGLILARDALQNPSVVELVAADKVSIVGKGPIITKYRIAGTQYEPRDVWHERQYPVPGIPLGLSPIAYGAMSIGQYLSAQQFALDWFTNGAIPAGRLKNVGKTLTAKEARIAKDRFKAAVSNRDLFVHGADWEYDMIQVAGNESQFLDTMRAGVIDIARFLGVPSDLIDAEAQSSAKITYANITQRNLQLLVMHLGPAITRRELALSNALVRPRYVKFNTDAILRMDSQTRESMLGAMIAARQLAPSEAREIDNRPPFTDDQLAEFDRLFGKAQANPSPSTGVPK